jgi:uncharacterized membrane protein
MRSKAAIHGHPIHPILVTIPIGAVLSAALGDVLYTLRGQPQWFEFSRLAISVGLLAAPLAAIAGLADYFGLRLPSRTARTATFHLGFNVVALLFYSISLMLRSQGAPLGGGWGWAMTLSTLGLLVLGASGWLGGKLVFEHHVGVIENETKGAGS